MTRSRDGRRWPTNSKRKLSLSLIKWKFRVGSAYKNRKKMSYWRRNWEKSRRSLLRERWYFRLRSARRSSSSNFMRPNTKAKSRLLKNMLGLSIISRRRLKRLRNVKTSSIIFIKYMRTTTKTSKKLWSVPTIASNDSRKKWKI